MIDWLRNNRTERNWISIDLFSSGFLNGVVACTVRIYLNTSKSTVTDQRTVTISVIPAHASDDGNYGGYCGGNGDLTVVTWQW